ncbi:hypothetical protein [Psychrosphaera algicola]|uniref:Uncharacterized protein n=2 Tax=Psychrosphaera TaxID=907197 RepID=A0ABT5FJP9_9GAMM|nr:hypothetical protein [Psychrosphaera sp. G1-22]MDC2891423.1 hypothetical protein [Psychrosphaera sp. G1-22]
MSEKFRMLNVKAKIARKIRDKAIMRANTRIILAGKTANDFDEEQLEVIVREEEDKIKGNAKERGLMALAAMLGLSLWG